MIQNKLTTILVIIAIAIFSSCTKKEKFTITDIFGVPILNASVTQNGKAITSSSITGEIELVLPKENISENIVIAKDGFMTNSFDIYNSSGFISTRNFDMNSGIKLYNNFEQNEVYLLDKKNKKYIKLEQADFNIQAEKLDFHWEGPIQNDYYYPSGEFNKISKANFKGLIISYSKPMNFFRVKDDGSFIKRIISYMGNPKIESITISLNTKEISNNGKYAYADLSKGRYVLTGRGEGIGGNFSVSATKPIFLIEIQ